MHGDANHNLNKMTYYELRDIYGTKLLENFSPLKKANFKVTPI